MSLMISLHIVFLLIWSAALLYFPQLFVRQACEDAAAEQRRAVHMQHTLYAYVMTPSALFTVIAGGWLIFERGSSGGWLPVKLGLVLLMVFFHIYCGELMGEFRQGEMRRHVLFFHVLPLVPVALIVGVVALVVAKPF